MKTMNRKTRSLLYFKVIIIVIVIGLFGFAGSRMKTEGQLSIENNKANIENNKANY